MGVIHTWVLTLCVVAAGLLPAARAAEGEDRVKVIEERIKDARQELNESARRLAELHSQLWRLETRGPRSQRPMLGVLVDDSGSADGLSLVGVTPDGGAEQAGLKAGDRIVAVNGVRVDRPGDKKPLHLLSEAMSSVRTGDTVSVRFVRDGKTLEADVRTVERGEYMEKVMAEKEEWLEGLEDLSEFEGLEALEALEALDVLAELKASKAVGKGLELSENITRVPAGLRLEDVTGGLASYFDVERGVVVLGVPERVTALEPGDVLLEIAGVAVTGADAALERLAKLEGRVETQVKRRGQVRQVELDADALNTQQAMHVVRGDRRIRIQQLKEGDQVRLEISVDE